MPHPADIKRLQAAAKTRAAPTAQQANPTRTPKKSPNAMSLEEFMKRNPSARDLDREKANRQKKIKKAQVKQGRRKPSVRQTQRSQRPNPRESVPMPRSTRALMNNPILSREVKKHLK
jgi:hypothetical protein